MSNVCRVRHAGFLILLLCLLLLASCGKPVPRTLTLDAGQEEEAKELLKRFQERQLPDLVDADVRIGWEAWGSKGSAAALLQMQRPARLRFSVNDPLGRPLLLLATDGKAFTLVDNQKGQAYQGRTDSAFWHEYLPDALLPEDLFFFLGGRLSPVTAMVQSGLEVSREGFWYNWIDSHRLEHYVLLNRFSGRMDRRLLFDSNGDLALDITYSAYRLMPGSALSWPGHLLIKGEGIRGTFTLQVEQMYPQQDFSPTIFLLSVPPHFPVEEVR